MKKIIYDGQESYTFRNGKKIFKKNKCHSLNCSCDKCCQRAKEVLKSINKIEIDNKEQEKEDYQ